MLYSLRSPDLLILWLNFRGRNEVGNTDVFAVPFTGHCLSFKRHWIRSLEFTGELL